MKNLKRKTIYVYQFLLAVETETYVYHLIVDIKAEESLD